MCEVYNQCLLFVCDQTTFPKLYQDLQLHDSGLWSAFSRSSQCEQELPPFVCKKLTAFQQLLVMQATRPDRLQSAMTQFACSALGNVSLPPSSSLSLCLCVCICHHTTAFRCTDGRNLNRTLVSTCCRNLFHDWILQFPTTHSHNAFALLRKSRLQQMQPIPITSTIASPKPRHTSCLCQSGLILSTSGGYNHGWDQFCVFLNH